MVAGLVILVVVVLAMPTQRCTEQSPCLPDPVGSVLIGLLAAVPFLGWLDLRLGATASALGAAGLIWDGTAPLWVRLLAAIAAIAVTALVWRARRPAEQTSVQPTRELREMPQPRRFLAPPGLTLAFAVLLAAAIVCVFLGTSRQAAVDEQARNATVVRALVWGAIDDSSLRVHLPDGSTTVVGVVDAHSYPVNTTIGLAVDDRGLRQPLAEPYDATPWYALAVLLALLAAGLGLRLAGNVVALRRLFREAQPVTDVFVLRAPGRIVVFRNRAIRRRSRMGEIPVPVNPLQPRHVRMPMDQRTEPAVLFGVPEPGRWCTVSIDGDPVVPSGPWRVGSQATPERERIVGFGESFIIVAVIVAAGVLGVMYRDTSQRSLADLACTSDGCNAVAMATVGWSVLGLPMLLIAAAYRRFGSSRLAVAIMTAGLSLMTFGLGTFLVGEGEVEAVEAAQPELAMVVLGLGFAIGALIVARGIALTKRVSRAEADRPGTALSVLAVCELVALGVAVAFAALP